MTTINEQQPEGKRLSPLELARLFEQQDRDLLPGLPPYGPLSQAEIEQAARAATAQGDSIDARRVAFAEARLQLLREAGELTLGAPPPPPAPLSTYRLELSGDLPTEEEEPVVMSDPAPQVVQLNGFSTVTYDNPSNRSTTFPLVTSQGVAIDYLSPQHIHVYKSAVGSSNETELTRPLQWDFDATGTAVVLKTPVSGSVSIRIRRHTPADKRLAVFQKGTLLTADQLNSSSSQNFYIIQEMADRLAAALPSS
jgi:hypothetical protein